MPTKTKTKALVLEAAPEQPLAAPETEGDRLVRITKAMYKPDPPREMRQAFRDLLEQKPGIALLHGTMASMARDQGLTRYASMPVVEESIRFQLEQMHKDLAGEQPTTLEALLADAVVLSYQDYFSFSMLYSDKTKSFTLEDMTKWEHILASKEQRYLRAIGELARVRRLLNLPAPQVNINLPGGQQVNVQGKAEL